MAATRVYSTAAYYVAAIVAILFGFSPKFGALVASTPGGVLGGITVVLYGMIGLLGAKIWKENGVDFGNPINLVPVAAGIVIGIGNVTLKFTDSFSLTGIALGTIVAVGGLPPRQGARPRPSCATGPTAPGGSSPSAAARPTATATGSTTSTRATTAADTLGVGPRPAIGGPHPSSLRPSPHRPEKAGSVREARPVRAPRTANRRRRRSRCWPRSGHDGKVLAGGQSLIPILNMRLASPAHLVDINQVAGLADGDRDRRRGAGGRAGAPRPARAPRRGVCRAAAAAPGAASTWPIPSSATAAPRSGSIAHADAAGEMPAMLALTDGVVEAVSASGPREIAVAGLLPRRPRDVADRGGAGRRGAVPRGSLPAPAPRSWSAPAGTATTPWRGSRRRCRVTDGVVADARLSFVSVTDVPRDPRRDRGLRGAGARRGRLGRSRATSCTPPSNRRATSTRPPSTAPCSPSSSPASPWPRPPRRRPSAATATGRAT